MILKLNNFYFKISMLDNEDSKNRDLRIECKVFKSSDQKF